MTGVFIISICFYFPDFTKFKILFDEKYFALSCLLLTGVLTTDFKSIIKKKKGNKDFLNSILTSANESIIVINMDGEIIYHNEATGRMFGYEDGELPGKKIEVLVPEKNRENHAQYRRQFQWHEQTHKMGANSELYAVRKNGTQFSVEISFGSFFTNDEMYITCFVMDNTFRKSAENEVKNKNIALAKSEAFLNSIIQNLPLYLMVRDLATMDIILENKRIFDLLGFLKEEYEGKTIKDFIGVVYSREQAEITEKANRDALETKKIIVLPEFPVYSKSGEEKILRLTKLPVFDDENKPLFLITIGEDITEWTRSRQELKKDHQLLVESQEIGNVGSFESDIIRENITLSEEFVKIMGITPKSQYKYDDLINLVHPDDKAKIAQGMEQAILNKTSFNDSYRIIRPDGEIRNVWLKAKAVYSLSGRPLRIMGVASDITEIKKAEEEIKNKNQELYNTNLLLSIVNFDLEQFVYATSHEMQEPLRMIVSHVQMLKKHIESQLCEEQKEQFKFVIDEAKRMLQIIVGIREYINVNNIEEDTKIVDCNMLMKGAEKTLSEYIKTHKAVIKADVLPKIRGKELRLTWLFRVLLENAIKFRSEKIPEIHVSAIELKDAWEFHIKDNGISIDPKYQDKIFMIFKKLHCNTEYSGAGIGLAIAKKIVKQHGGEIWYQSQKGSGTCFYFTIPK